jgi:hypothetical protein
MIGASPEVLEHHDRIHRRQCLSDLPPQIFNCPCGVCTVIICGRCDEPVFVAVRPGSEVCEHAQMFLDLANP